MTTTKSKTPHLFAFYKLVSHGGWTTGQLEQVAIGDHHRTCKKMSNEADPFEEGHLGEATSWSLVDDEHKVMHATKIVQIVTLLERFGYRVVEPMP